jgi:hypothetical protein
MYPKASSHPPKRFEQRVGTSGRLRIADSRMQFSCGQRAVFALGAVRTASHGAGERFVPLDR